MLARFRVLCTPRPTKPGGGINGIASNPRPAKIISMSFAGTGACPSYLQSAIDQAHGLGAELIAASGNKGLDNVDSTFPANCVHVISVGATTRAGLVATYSNLGASRLVPGGDWSNPIPVIGGDMQVGLAVGTSFAVPHVVGLSALNMISTSAVSHGLVYASVDYTCAAGSYNPTTGQWPMIISNPLSSFLLSTVYKYYTMVNGLPAYCSVPNCDLFIWWDPTYSVWPKGSSIGFTSHGFLRYPPYTGMSALLSEVSTMEYCLSCNSGTYAVGIGNTVCTSCSVQVPSNASLNVTVVDGITCPWTCSSGFVRVGNTSRGMFALMAGYQPLNDMCCVTDTPIGTYIKCNRTSNVIVSCPPINNGSYRFNFESNHVNRCLMWACSDGFYSTPDDPAIAMSVCGLPTQYISPNTTCVLFLATVCKPVMQCGTSLWLTDVQHNFILDSNNDRQCTPCSSCVSGGIPVRGCDIPTNSQQMCAKCQSTGGVVLYEYNGTCVDFLASPSGYFPYQLTYSPDLLSTITNNSMMTFPSVEMTGVSTFVPISWTNNVRLNVYVPCVLPPISRQFKAWGPNNPVAVTCNNFQCADFHAPCDLLASTECTGWNPVIKQGWFTDGLGACVACTNTSSVRPCSWGQYGDLTQCTTNHDSQCASCVGTLPGNATWTVSIAPHYYFEHSSTQCEWECTKGFYRSGNQCIACVKPAHSYFLDGPTMISGTEPPPMTCLTPSDCKYFGGTAQLGCQWKCDYLYVQETSFIVGSSPYCVPCPAVTCSPGMLKYPDQSTGCDKCQSCTPVVANANYGDECVFTCNYGYFKSSSISCQACSVVTCLSSQYLIACAGVTDSRCVSCLVCPTGQQQVAACGVTSNTQCAPCSNALVSNSYYSAACDISCNAGFVMSGELCLQCASICRYDKMRSASCTAENMGCDFCSVPATWNWCWTGLSECSWDCDIYYTKFQNRCVYNVLKTTAPVCVGPVVVQSSVDTGSTSKTIVFVTSALPGSTSISSVTTSVTRAIPGSTSTTSASARLVSTSKASVTSALSGSTSTTSASARLVSTSKASVTSALPGSTSRASVSTSRVSVTSALPGSTSRASVSTSRVSVTTTMFM